MKKTRIFFMLMVSLFCLSGHAQNEYQAILDTKYIPADQELFKEILAMDKKYFDAYNECDMDTQAALYAEDLEFFHDQGGLSTSKPQLLESLKNNICGKVTRTLIKGSVEVYPIPNYGAIEMGYHKFYNNQEPNAKSKPGRFVLLWKKEDEKWIIAKVISLH